MILFRIKKCSCIIALQCVTTIKLCAVVFTLIIEYVLAHDVFKVLFLSKIQNC
jgi:hypothetical protein